MKYKINRKEHETLYKTLNVIVYIIFLPFVLLFYILELFGKLGELIEQALIEIRYFIVGFIFHVIFNKKNQQ